jgi:hypothetical protein
MVAAAAGGLVVAGTVVAASTGSASGDDLRLGNPNLTPVLIVAGVAVGAVAVMILVDLIRGLERGPLPKHGRTIRDLLLLVGLVVLILLFAQLFPEREVSGNPGAAPDLGPGSESAAEPDDGGFAVGLAVVAVTTLVIVVALRRRHPQARRSGPSADSPDLAEEVGEVLDDTIARLRDEADPRQAVIAAYARMEDVFARHGAPRRASEAPLEFLARALEHVSRADAAARLTDLFERAMFSTEPFDRARQDEAIDALVAVRDDVRRPAPAAAGPG